MKILLAVDNSAASRKAFDFVIKTAKAEDEILLLSVVPDYEDVVIGPLGSVEYTSLSEVAEEQKKQLRILLRDCGKELNEKNFVNIKCLLASGPVCDVICNEASGQKVDLIVVGQRSRMSTLASILDSESTAVSHRARCSVVVVKYHPEVLSKNHEKQKHVTEHVNHE